MGKGRLEARITIPAGGWGGTIDDSGGGAAVAWSIAAGEYYLSDLLDALADALNLAAPTDTITVSASLGEGGTGKVSITSSGNASIVWTSSDIRDLLGYTTNLTLTAAVASTAPNQAEPVWIADCPYDAPNQVFPWTGWPEGDARSSESAGGRVFSLFGRKKRATWLRWEAVARTRASQANESTVNESFERFLIDGIWGEAAWATPGGYVRFYPDADGSNWVEYAVVMPKDFKPEHFVSGWAGGPWTCKFDRLVVQDVSDDRATLTPTLLTSGSSSTDGSSVATSAFQPSANAAVYAFVVAAQSPTVIPTASGNGLTWVMEESIEFGSGPPARLTVFRAMGAAPSAGAVTFDFGGASQQSFAWSVVQVPLADTGGSSASAATRQSVSTSSGAVTSITNTLAALEHATNVHLVATALRISSTVTPDGDFAELSDSNIGSANLTLEVQWAANQTGVTPSFSSSTVAVISLEVVSG